MPTGRGVDTPRWHAYQLLGPPDVTPASWGDSDLALCFGSALPRGYAEGGDEYLTYAWNGAANLESYGWSEYFEFDVEEEIYVSRVEFGENRGAGAVVAIWAWENATATWGLLWSGTATDEVDTVYQATNMYRVFVPSPVCRLPFATRRLRVEVDTETVSDWNEYDYAKVTGYAADDGIIAATETLV